MLCELIGGFNPFYNSDPMQMYENILKANAKWPKNMDSATKDLLQKEVFILDPNLRVTIDGIK